MQTIQFSYKEEDNVIIQFKLFESFQRFIPDTFIVLLCVCVHLGYTLSFCLSLLLDVLWDRSIFICL